MSSAINIPALFSDVVARINKAFAKKRPGFPTVYFSFGHYDEVTDTLLSKGASISQKANRYPLIWLIMDFTERYPEGAAPYAVELPNLTMIIAVPTMQGSNTEKRIEATFKQQLYPIYDELKKQLVDSGHFQLQDSESIPHEKLDRPYWNGADSPAKGGANLFNDHIDAIQVRSLRLFVNEPVLQQFKIHF